MFTIDAMLSHGKDLSQGTLLFIGGQERSPHSLDSAKRSSNSSMTTVEQTSFSSSVAIPPTAKALFNFVHTKNVIESTVESARLRHKHLENEIGRRMDMGDSADEPMSF